MAQKNYINKRTNGQKRKVEQEEIKVKSGKVSASSRDTAMVLDFAALQRLLVQNVTKTQTKTFTQYTRANVQSYLQSPYTNMDNIRSVSNFLWRNCMPYKKLLEYYALMPLYSYNVSFQSKDWSIGADLSQDEFIKNYQEVLHRTDNMNLKDEMQKASLYCLMDGIFAGFIYDDEESFFIQRLDPRYIRIKSVQNGIYTVAFNAAYFDSGTNKDMIIASDENVKEDGLWDSCFLNGYNEYKDKGRNYQWFELPPERTFCIISGEDPTMPIPYFSNLFVDMLDLIDFQSIIRDKTALENFVLLVSKIPTFSNTEEVDDFKIDLDTATNFQSLVDAVIPSQCGTALSPLEIEPIFFNNKNATEETDIIAQATHNLFTNAGVAETIFNSNSSNSIGIGAAIKADELLSFKLLDRMSRCIQNYIVNNISEDFLFKFHRVTYFSKDSYESSLATKATSGLPVKMDYATIDKSPYEVMNDTFVENSLGLENLWKPLNLSYTQSSSTNTGEVGAPEKDGVISDSGDSSRANEDAENAKATQEQT